MTVAEAIKIKDTFEIEDFKLVQNRRKKFILVFFVGQRKSNQYLEIE